jgi:hypothetical protein
MWRQWGWEIQWWRARGKGGGAGVLGKSSWMRFPFYPYRCNINRSLHRNFKSDEPLDSQSAYVTLSFQVSTRVKYVTYAMDYLLIHFNINSPTCSLIIIGSFLFPSLDLVDNQQ